MTRTPLSCYLIGADTLLTECGNILLQDGHDIRGVISATPRILAWAGKNGIETIDPADDWGEQIRAAKPFDVLFAITHLSIIPDEILTIPTRMGVNFHDGPLPRYAGLNAPVWALLNREEQYGVSWHVMTPGVDQGDLLAQKHFDIAPDETALSLNTKCMAAALDLFPDLARALAEGREVRTPQDATQRSYFGRHDRPDALGLIDWSKTAADIAAHVRALTFGPYRNPVGSPWTAAEGSTPFIVVEAEVDGQNGAAGRVLEVGGSTVRVGAGEGSLKILAARAPDGTHLDPRALAEQHGLGEGAELVGHDSEAGRALDEEKTSVARSETFWERRLRTASYPDLPQAGAPTGAVRWARARVDLSEVGHVTPALVAGAWAISLARMSGTERVDLAWARSGAATPAALKAWISRSVPMRLELGAGDTLEGVAGRVDREVEVAAERGGFLRDLIARVPELSDQPKLAADQILPVGLSMGGGTPAGSLVSLDIDADGSGATLHFDAERLSVEAAAGIAEAVTAVLKSGTGDALWTDVPLITDAVRARLLDEWNDTQTDWPSDQCVHQLIEAQVDRTPEAVAVVCGTESLSYRQLDQRANTLAHRLRAEGIGPDDLVGVHVPRSVELLVATLGVMKAGGAYIPLDPDFPPDRLAFMIRDAGAGVIISHSSVSGDLPDHDATLVELGGDEGELAARGTDRVESGVSPANLAYVIYTSGSTGTPKGVLIEHRNVANFFAGMDPVVEHDPPSNWLAVTSLSFDISVLELFWTLARGFRVVVYADRAPDAGVDTAGANGFDASVTGRPIDFGLFMWGNDDGPGPDKYRLMMEGAKYFDQNGFHSAWTPERHFHAFGGPFPNPSVTSAAIAAVTEHIQIRSGSCVSPLHHPIRIAEEWSVVDNLSNGRVGLSFAAGWQPNDFVIRPESFGDQKTLMLEQIDVVRRLWRGESVEFENPKGKMVPVQTLPRPVQPELPFWITTAGNPDSYAAAGRLGANVLTHLLGQSVDEVAEKIAIYRKARAEAGFDPESGKITLMLHTFVGTDDDAVREIVRQPMKDYLGASMKLVLGFAWSFPAFKRPGGADQQPEDVDLGSLSKEDTEAILDFAFERYYETSGLFGTVDSCIEMVNRVKSTGADEIACLLDFGVDTDRVMDSLPLLKTVKDATARPEAVDATTEVDSAHDEKAAEQTGFAARVKAHDITHLQCTPSMARLILADPEARPGLDHIQRLMIGGEAFPPDLAAELAGIVDGPITNMYGPTETTIWSSTQQVSGSESDIPIGRPIANTRMYVLDRWQNPMPPGVAGELWIGGRGVARGYHERPQLTAERFVPDPFANGVGTTSGEVTPTNGASSPSIGRMYRTGDLARFRNDGVLDFLGRVDRQVKFRGYRIELGEIEALLDGHDEVRMSAVLLREDQPGNPQLVAYVIPEGEEPADDQLRRHLRRALPEYMVPGLFVLLDRMPLTPNGKIDRKALPAPSEARTTSRAEYVEPDSETERVIAECWTRTLQVERVGVEDNFFDIGGHSLLVVQLHRLITEQISQPLSLVDLYRFPTIRSLTEHLDSDGPDAAMQESIDRAEERRKAMANRRRRR